MQTTTPGPFCARCKLRTGRAPRFLLCLSCSSKTTGENVTARMRATEIASLQTAVFLGNIEMTDPRNGNRIELAVFHDGDNETGTAFALETSFLDTGGNYDTVDPDNDESDPVIPSPFASARHAVSSAGDRIRLMGRLA